MASVVEEIHVQAKLFTKLKRFNTADTPFSLPAISGCSELNALLTGIIFGDETGHENVQFDFLINGEFLRSTITEYISNKDISTESVIEIEYILKEDSPRLEQSLQHDDWVSSVDMMNDFILTGSYDNTISIWTLQGKCITAMEGHTKSVKSISWITCKQQEGSFLSASQDQTVLIWQFDPKNGKSECVHICRGHAGSVDCLAVQPSGIKFASGSWDKIIKIWEAGIKSDATDESEIDDNKKKSRTQTNEKKITNRIPLISLSGHKEPVSALVWNEETEIMSAGWDHCIRLWDIETALNKHTLTGSKVILDISYSAQRQLLASGSADKYIRLWDPRINDGVVVKSILSSHEGWVSSVQWSPESEYQLASASYDNTIKLWDVRSTSNALYDLEKHDDKAMCLCWKKEDVILSGGADCRVHIYKQNGRTISPVAPEE